MQAELNREGSPNTVIDIVADKNMNVTVGMDAMDIDRLLIESVLEDNRTIEDNDEIELIYDILMQITLKILNRLSSQDVCILSTPNNGCALASASSNSTQRYN